MGKDRRVSFILPWSVILFGGAGTGSGFVPGGCIGCKGYTRSAETVEIHVNAAHSGIIRGMISTMEGSRKETELEFPTATRF